MIKVHGVIVTYHPNLDVLSNNIANLIAGKSLDAIHVVDNTPGGANFNQMVFQGVHVHSLGINKGIATAQNAGIQAALDSDADYVILFDQDSHLEVDLVDNLISVMLKAKQNNINLACIGPRPLDVFSGKKYRPLIQKEKEISSEVSLCSQIIASGKLIDTTVLHRIGLMEDSLFIDGVDHEWCWRATSFGYSIGIAEQVVMHHTLGDARGKILGLTYKIGSAVRMYYQFRNILILSRRGYVPTYWKVRNILSIFLRFFIFGFGREDSSLRRHYMIKGLVDGLKMKMGPYTKE